VKGQQEDGAAHAGGKQYVTVLLEHLAHAHWTAASCEVAVSSFTFGCLCATGCTVLKLGLISV
jgi:hypothetical protein